MCVFKLKKPSLVHFRPTRKEFIQQQNLTGWDWSVCSQKKNKTKQVKWAYIIKYSFFCYTKCMVEVLIYSICKSFVLVLAYFSLFTTRGSRSLQKQEFAKARQTLLVSPSMYCMTVNCFGEKSNLYYLRFRVIYNVSSDTISY